MRMNLKDRQTAVSNLNFVFSSDSVEFTEQHSRPFGGHGASPFIQMRITGKGCSCLLVIEDEQAIQMLKMAQSDMERHASVLTAFLHSAESIEEGSDDSKTQKV